jgi:hypothetical protein
MGWYAVAEALKNGEGPYGSVKESLRGEMDGARTLLVALDQVQQAVDTGEYTPDRAAKARLSYWSRRMGWPKIRCHRRVARNGVPFTNENDT